MAEEQPPNTLKFMADSEHILPEVVQMLVHIRAAIDALAILTIKTCARVHHTNVEEIAKIYDQLKADNVIRLAVELHERIGEDIQE